MPVSPGLVRGSFLPMIKRLELILFDMDGVLADTEPLHFQAVNRVLSQEGVTISEEENQKFLGCRDDGYFSALKEAYGLERPVEEYVRRKGQEVILLVSEGIVPARGLCELLLRLRMQGVKTAIASSSVPELIEAVVNTLGLRRSFDGLFSGFMVPNGKPSPDLFLFASKQLKVEPASCLVIEDAPAGIEAARRAGMGVVAVRTGMISEDELSGADLIVSSLDELDLDSFHVS